MDNECDRDPQCGVLLVKMKLMMEGQNRSINRTHGSTLVIFARLWIYTPRSGMLKFEIEQVYYAEDENYG